MPAGNEQERVGLVFSEPLDEGLGHSFCYVRPPVLESARFSPGSQSERFGFLASNDTEAAAAGLEEPPGSSFRFLQQEEERTTNPKSSSGGGGNGGGVGVAETTTFKSISGASVSANTSTPRTVVASSHGGGAETYSNGAAFANAAAHDRAAAFESTASFSSLPLQPCPRAGMSGPMSGPLSGALQQDRSFMSAPLERARFMSGPLERAVMSGPLENIDRGHFSAPLGGPSGATAHHMAYLRKRKRYFSRFVRTVRRPLGKMLPAVLQLVGWQQAKDYDKYGPARGGSGVYDSGVFAGYPSEDNVYSNINVQWAQGKAGEDRIQVVLSEEHGWLFVGIYDGFNGPDAPEFLMGNLYKAIYDELQGLLWDRKPDCPHAQSQQQNPNASEPRSDDCCPNAQPQQHNPNGAEARSEDYSPNAQPQQNNPNNTEARSEVCANAQPQQHSPNEGIAARSEDRPHALPLQDNPNRLVGPEASQEDCSEPLRQSPDHQQDPQAKQEECSNERLSPHRNPGELEANEENQPTARTGQQKPDLRQDLKGKREHPEGKDKDLRISEHEMTDKDQRYQPPRTIASENPPIKTHEIDTECSNCSVKLTGSEGDPRPSTEFIKRVTFQCEKKGSREGIKSKSLRELLAEEEDDDSLDFSVWNPTTNFVISSQNTQQRTAKPLSRSTAPAADESRLALDGSGETSEGNGATDQISDPQTRRATNSDSEQKQGKGMSLLSSKLRLSYSKRKENHRKLFPWRYDWEKEPIEVERKIDERIKHNAQRCNACAVDHGSVLKALSRALEVTEEAYLEMTDRVLDENPELALMGSCLLVMLMKDQDVYVMNVGDSRAIVAQLSPETNSSTKQHCSHRKGDGHDRVGSKEAFVRSELEDITEEPPADSAPIEANGNDGSELPAPGTKLSALQLSTDHSTSIEEEVIRIKAEHPDDSQSILNDRVKGRLKVTRAFGAGFLKQPKWNNALLEMFRNDYIGTAPYITCMPSLRHHRLGPNDQFLVLSSDGLYQYLSNQEVVSQVELFMANNPDGDPAQHLIEELLVRAANKAGMDFYELLDIPQGDRRKYHDDVSVMVIALEGRRIWRWRSSGKY